MQVINHKDFCHFKYDGPEVNENFKLGDVVFKESELQDDSNPIGVVIQIFEDGDCRTDMYGNVSSEEVRKPSGEEIEMYRPEILYQCIDLKDIEENLDVRAKQHDDSNAVLVKDLISGFEAWIDVDVVNDDVVADWNKYIFFLDNNDDLRARIIQSSSWVYEIFTSCAINYLQDVEILFQDEQGKWSWTKKETI